MREEESSKFIAGIPVVWDDTHVLDAKIGDYIGLARKSGDDWFIGIMGDGEVRDFEIDFSFLSEGEYTMEYFSDGVNAHRYASDYKKQNKKIKASDKMTIKLAPGGGWAAKIQLDKK
jgi:alpha-glucosidase